MYYVEHVREGKSFATRTVQARQRGKCIFTTTMSFVREKSGGKHTVSHAVPLPQDILQPDDSDILEGGGSPFVSHRVEILNRDSKNPHEKKTRQWIKARGRISDEGGHQAHLSALAYMSDSYFIGTISRIHDLWRWGTSQNLKKGESGDNEMVQRENYIKKMKEFEGFGDDLENAKGRPEVGMMVSLDHTIYFHEPRAFRADEWMFTEMSSPWSGDGRGVVQQHMFSADGTLVATCFQEVQSPACIQRVSTNMLAGRRKIKRSSRTKTIEIVRGERLSEIFQQECITSALHVQSRSLKGHDHIQEPNTVETFILGTTNLQPLPNLHYRRTGNTRIYQQGRVLF